MSSSVPLPYSPIRWTSSSSSDDSDDNRNRNRNHIHNINHTAAVVGPAKAPNRGSRRVSVTSSKRRRQLVDNGDTSTDTTDDDNLFVLSEWTNQTKNKKLSKVTDPLARNLLSQILHRYCLATFILLYYYLFILILLPVFFDSFLFKKSSPHFYSTQCLYLSRVSFFQKPLTSTNYTQDPRPSFSIVQEGRQTCRVRTMI